MKAANDGVRFLVEVASLGAIAYWGFHDHTSLLLKLAFGIGGPLLIAFIWARWMAPRSSRRAPEAQRALLELAIFGAGALALAASVGAASAIVFALGAGVNALLDHRFARTP